MILTLALLFGSSLCPDVYTIDSTTPERCLGRSLMEGLMQVPYDYIAFGRVTFGQLASTQYPSKLYVIYSPELCIQYETSWYADGEEIQEAEINITGLTECTTEKQ